MMKQGRIVSLLLVCSGLLAVFFVLDHAHPKQTSSLYQTLIQQNDPALEILDTMADSSAEKGQIGLAVLYYERALLLAPGNAELRAALSDLRKKAGLFREESRPERLAALLGADQWLLLSGVAFVLLALTVLAIGVLGRQRFPQACRLSAVFLIATVLPLPPAWLRYQSWQEGVVTAEAARLLISPFKDAEPVAHLKAGMIVRPLAKKHEHYVLVRDQEGRKGWLEQGSFQQIAGQ
ncbi:hypothetical protein [Candidatus Electronema sp. PJ]|uniref:hypothetical protein n=1 Tax=Candidatus Electronema sp. PJ TaxID=3401572 RepID=UPI003AA930DF